MTGKTHLVLGETAALALLQPDGLREITLCIGAAAVGSAICDMDASASRARRELTRILVLVAMSVGACVLMEQVFRVEILALLQRQVMLWKALCGGGVFLLLCAAGMQLPHRTLLHSLPCWVVFTAIFQQAAPPLADAFSVAMLSHIVLDLLNYRQVALLYPLREGLCLGLCHTGGKTDRLLFRVGSALWLAALLFCLFQSFFL